MLQSEFASCGDNVIVEPGVHIERPDLFHVGSNVRIAAGFYCQDAPQVHLGSNVTFFPGCFVQGNGTVRIADDVAFYPHTYLSTGTGRIQVGHTSHFAAGCALYGGRDLIIGAYANIAAHVVLATVEHDPRLTDRPMALAPSRGGPVVLHDDVWIGANATVTPGTTIATGCIIGAGAVLTRDTRPNGVYAGVPARRIRDRPTS